MSNDKQTDAARVGRSGLVRHSLREARKSAAKHDIAKALFYATCGDYEKAAYVTNRALKTMRLVNARRPNS